MKSFYHFLGSIRFTIVLIATTTLFVIAGTFIESATDSHRYAAYFTYGNPAFGFLLSLFFINILISSLRRWPFRKGHIPFLITHFGLLMILGGTIIKSNFGIQGSMAVTEGSHSQRIFLPDSYVIHAEARHSTQAYEYPLYNMQQGFPNLQLSLAQFSPHSSERMETWIKGDIAYVRGEPPFPVIECYDLNAIPLGLESFAAYRTPDVEDLARKLFIEKTAIRIADKKSQNTLFEGPLSEAQASLYFDISLVKGLGEPHLTVGNVLIPLSGDHALDNINLSTSYLGNAPIVVDLASSPSIMFLQDFQGDTFLFAISAHGEIYFEPFRQDNLSQFIVYNRGFGGYAAQATLPPFHSRAEREVMKMAQLKQELRQGLNRELSPPLKILKQACEKCGEDFVELTLQLFSAWDASHCWLWPMDTPLEAPLNLVMAQVKIPSKEKLACAWMSQFTEELTDRLQEGEDFIELLSQRGWPLLDALEEQRGNSGPVKPEELSGLLTTLSQQIFGVADLLPKPNPQPETPSYQAHLLTAYFRLYGIHLSRITPDFISSSDGMILETPLTLLHHDEFPQRKLEDNLPKVKLNVSNGNTTEQITLSYDRYARGLKWPILNGDYLIRFQPAFQTIPYRVRLRQARQINYANSNQPYSFEADLIVEDMRDNTIVEKTISMNNVHETWDGYRFYLANISPNAPGAVKQAQIVVNHDPVKYFVTYPGGVILALGIVLLFLKKLK